MDNPRLSKSHLSSAVQNSSSGVTCSLRWNDCDNTIWSDSYTKYTQCCRRRLLSHIDFATVNYVRYNALSFERKIVLWLPLQYGTKKKAQHLIRPYNGFSVLSIKMFKHWTNVFRNPSTKSWDKLLSYCWNLLNNLNLSHEGFDQNGEASSLLRIQILEHKNTVVIRLVWSKLKDASITRPHMV